MARPLTAGALAVAAAAALVLGACSDGGGDKADRKPDRTTTEAPTTGTTTETPNTGTVPGGGDPSGGTGVTLGFRPVLASVPLSPGQTCNAKQEGDLSAGVEGRPPASAPDTTIPPQPAQEVALASADGTTCYGLGAEAFDSTALTGGRAVQVQGQWAIQARAKADRATTVASLFESCYVANAVCPAVGDLAQGHGSVALVLDGMVLTAPVVQTRATSDQPLQLVGGFTETEARALARELQ